MRRLWMLLLLAGGCSGLGVGVWRLHKSRTVQTFGTIVARVNTRDSLVALTLDDGPRRAETDTILAALREARIPATFFFVGRNAARQLDDVRRVIALGNEVANHTYSHEWMLFRSPGFIASEVEKTDSVLRAAGWRGAILFRPPYGKRLVGLPYYLWRTGRATIMCDVEPDSYDSVAGNPARMAAFVVQQARPGSIILLHPWAHAADRAAITLVAWGLTERGYRFVTVSELLQHTGK